MATTIKDKLIRHQILIQRLAASQYDSMEQFIDDAVQRTMLRLGGKRYLSPSEAQALEKELGTLLERMSVTTMQNLDDFAVYESKFIARVLNGQTPVADKVTRGLRMRRMGVGLSTGKRAQSIPVSLRQFNRNRARELAKRARQVVLQQLDRNQIEEQFLQLSRKIKAQARSLSTTLVNHTAIVAKDITYLANRDKIDFLVWSAVLDQNTTNYCRGQHGNRYPIDDGPRPPAHFNCRSIMIVVLK